MKIYNFCRLCGNILQAEPHEYSSNMYCWCKDIQEKGFCPVYLGGGLVGWSIDATERSIVVSQIDIETFPALSDRVNVGFYAGPDMVASIEEILFSEFFDGSDWSNFLQSGKLPDQAARI